MDTKVLAIIDVNANRLREALRVCEDITRFVLMDKRLTQDFKLLRHKAALAVRKFEGSEKILARFREPAKDIGKRTIRSEIRRSGVADIFRANIRRAEEAVRVLEEFSKLCKTKMRLPEIFKAMRFKLYCLEKDVVKRL